MAIAPPWGSNIIFVFFTYFHESPATQCHSINVPIITHCGMRYSDRLAPFQNTVPQSFVFDYYTEKREREKIGQAKKLTFGDSHSVRDRSCLHNETNNE